MTQENPLANLESFYEGSQNIVIYNLILSSKWLALSISEEKYLDIRDREIRTQKRWNSNSSSEKKKKPKNKTQVSETWLSKLPPKHFRQEILS